MDINFTIRVRCMTFNHAPYIEDAMNGFCIQETTFPFVCVIMDDASTDGEPEVIRKYFQENFDLDNDDIVRSKETDDYVMTFAQHKKNKNCYFAVYFLKYNHYSIKRTKETYICEWFDNVDYIAICEGDDYWIDPFKLQKQFEYLEGKKDVGMCYTKAIIVRNGKKVRTSNEPAIQTPLTMVLNGNSIITPTVLIRKKIMDNYYKEIDPQSKRWLMGDYPLWMYVSIHSKVERIGNVTTSYREHPGSATHNIDPEKSIAFIKAGTEVKLFFIENYPLLFKDKKKILKKVEVAEKKRMIIYYIGVNCYKRAYNVISLSNHLFLFYIYASLRHALSVFNKNSRSKLFK